MSRVFSHLLTVAAAGAVVLRPASRPPLPAPTQMMTPTTGAPAARPVGAGRNAGAVGSAFPYGGREGGVAMPIWPAYPPPSTASYAHVEPNRFHTTVDQPLSTFGADV